jgi:hypothetical protein
MAAALRLSKDYTIGPELDNFLQLVLDIGHVTSE